MESTFYESLSGSTSVNGGAQENLWTLKESLIETVQSMDSYQLLGALILFASCFMFFMNSAAGARALSTGYESGGGEFFLALLWLVAAGAGLGMMSGDFNLEGVRAVVEQNSAMIIALFVAFIMAATVTEALLIKSIIRG